MQSFDLGETGEKFAAKRIRKINEEVGLNCQQLLTQFKEAQFFMKIDKLIDGRTETKKKGTQGMRETNKLFLHQDNLALK
jgi:hypothetical protein